MSAPLPNRIAADARATDAAGKRRQSVIDGVIQYLSPSQLNTADHRQYGGCLRRWHWRYVSRKPEPTTASQSAGTEMHSQIEHYLKTGENVLGPLAMSGKRFIPEPGHDLLIEHAIHLPDPLLTAAGIPVHGFIDLAHRRLRYAQPDGDIGHDPPRTTTMEDWKSTGSDRRFKDATNASLADAVPMICYGEYGARRYPDTEHVRLSHVYFLTRGRPQAKKVTLRLHRSEVAKRYEQVEGVAHRMVGVAKIGDSNDVPANTAACDAFGGCPHKSYCRASGEANLSKLFGPTAALELKEGVDAAMSLLTGLGLTPADPTPTPPAATPEPSVTLSLAEQIAKLQAEEAAAQPRPAPPIERPPGFADAVDAIEAANIGFPRCTGKALQVLTILRGPSGEKMAAGSGKLAGIAPIEEPAAMVQLLSELRSAGWIKSATPPTVAPSTPAPPPAVGLLPEDAPASDPAKAADPLPTTPTAPVEPLPAVAQPAAEKPKRARKAAGTTPPEVPAVVQPAPQAAAPTTVINVAAPAVQSAAEAPQQVVAPQAAAGIELYVDCVPNAPYELFDRYVLAYAGTLAAKYAAVDIRCVDDKSPLAFGKWKGALFAMVRASLPPAGTYVILRRSEVAEVVADALCSHIAETQRGRYVMPVPR